MTEEFAHANPRLTWRVVTKLIEANAFITRSEKRDEAFDAWTLAGFPKSTFEANFDGVRLSQILNPLIDEYVVARHTGPTQAATAYGLLKNDPQIDTWFDRSYLDTALKEPGPEHFWSKRTASGDVAEIGTNDTGTVQPVSSNGGCPPRGSHRPAPSGRAGIPFFRVRCAHDPDPQSADHSSPGPAAAARGGPSADSRTRRGARDRAGAVVPAGASASVRRRRGLGAAADPARAFGRQAKPVGPCHRRKPGRAQPREPLARRPWLRGGLGRGSRAGHRARAVPGAARPCLAVAWFDGGDQGKIAFIAVAAFQPAIIRTWRGIAGVPEGYPALAAALRFTRRHYQAKPALPSIFTRRGRLSEGRQRFEMELLFLAMVLCGAVGLFCNTVAEAIEARFLNWTRT